MDKYIVEKLKQPKIKEQKHWVVVFNGGDEYDVYGSFNDVMKLWSEVGEYPIYISREYDYPVKTDVWEIMKQLKLV